MNSKDELKKKILKEMIVSHADSLEKNFGLAKELLKITSVGKVDLIKKDNLVGLDKILLYLIGKRYAKQANLTETEFVGNKELIEELGIKLGSLLPWIKTLRDAGKIESKEGQHAIKINFIEDTLKKISEKSKK